MSKERIQKAELDGAALCSLLKRVHLKGTVEECVLNIKNGVGTIQAVDMSNSIFISCEEELGKIEDITMGLGKLSLLVQFLEGSTAVSYIIESKEKQGVWLTLKRGEFGQIKVLLIEPTQIPTVVQGNIEEIKNNMFELITEKMNISQKNVEEISNYIGMIGCATVFFKVEKGSIYVYNNPESEQQFSFKLGIVESTNEAATEVYSQYLLAVLKSLKWTEKETPTICIGKESPVIIKQNESNFWAVTPIMV